MSRKTIDKRAARTRGSLADALLELGSQGDVDAMDVGDLAEKAGIGRSTFYAHYASKSEFIASSFADMIGMCEKEAAKIDPERLELIPARHLLHHIHEARAFAISLQRSSEGPAIFAAGEAKLRAIAEVNFARLRPNWTPAQRRDAAIFATGGFMSLLKAQVEGNHDPEQTYATWAEMARRMIAES